MSINMGKYCDIHVTRMYYTLIYCNLCEATRPVIAFCWHDKGLSWWTAWTLLMKQMLPLQDKN